MQNILLVLFKKNWSEWRDVVSDVLSTKIQVSDGKSGWMMWNKGIGWEWVMRESVGEVLPTPLATQRFKWHIKKN